MLPPTDKSGRARSELGETWIHLHHKLVVTVLLYEAWPRPRWAMSRGLLGPSMKVMLMLTEVRVLLIDWFAPHNVNL